MQKESFSTNSGKMFETVLEKGEYVFCITGYYIDEQVYNNGIYDEYDGLGAGNDSLNQPLKLKVAVGQKPEIEFYSTKPNFMYEYEYPYSISGVVSI